MLFVPPAPLGLYYIIIYRTRGATMHHSFYVRHVRKASEQRYGDRAPRIYDVENHHVHSRAQLKFLTF